MSAWEEIQAIKLKRNTLRERLEKRKKERQDILGINRTNSEGGPSSSEFPSNHYSNIKVELTNNERNFNDECRKSISNIKYEQQDDADIERAMIQLLSERSLILPTNSNQIAQKIEVILHKHIPNDSLFYYLQKLSAQHFITIKGVSIGTTFGYEIIQIEHRCMEKLYNDLRIGQENTSLKRRASEQDDDNDGEKLSKQEKSNESLSNTSDIMSLLSLPSTREKQNKQVGEEILELLTKPTSKERSLAEKFKSQGGIQVMEFCPYGTRVECMRSLEAAKAIEKANQLQEPISSESASDIVIKKEATDEDIKEPPQYKCNKLHFKKIIQSHTDECLGDCSFLNTCFHMDTCKYVHYEVDTFAGQNSKCDSDVLQNSTSDNMFSKRNIDPCATLYPPQWIQCDLRYLDMTVLGKFAVVMADPPWDIHMELPYGTMSDDEMRQLGVPALQDDGLIFLWVTGRAMELGRECLKLWGYERVDELIWVKTNQLQRIIRTGRTGHWLNHGKEHCLVGMKGNPPNLNRGLDCDVIVAEVRATSHKPDEIYGIIERLCPGTRKIELFGRPHNVQPNWITLGNQLDGIRLVDPELISSFQKRYPDGNTMTPGKNT